MLEVEFDGDFEAGEMVSMRPELEMKMSHKEPGSVSGRLAFLMDLTSLSSC